MAGTKLKLIGSEEKRKDERGDDRRIRKGKSGKENMGCQEAREGSILKLSFPFHTLSKK